MIYLSHADVSQLYTMQEAIDWVEQGVKALAEFRAVDSSRERTRIPQGTLHMLMGAAPEAGVVGFKAYYATPRGTRAHVFLYDAASGEQLAIIEGNHYFNEVRTGAASGVATRHLARRDAKVLGQIGAGLQAAAQLEAVCAVRSIERAQVYARTREPLMKFCDAMTAKLGIPVTAAESAEAVVRGADIVNLITKSPTPVLLGKWLGPGIHINAAGSNAFTRQEIDTEAARRCAVIAVDSRESARRECGDLLPLVEAGVLHWHALPEIGEIASGKCPGRTSNEQITLYESHGLAIQDLYVAAEVLKRAQVRGLGTRINA
jgi:ornithine cyclodeaminase